MTDTTENIVATINSSKSKLTAEQVKEFRKREKEANRLWDLFELGNEIAKHDDKEWAREIYLKALDRAKDISDFRIIADSVARDENLGDKNWARTIYKQALGKAITSALSF